MQSNPFKIQIREVPIKNSSDDYQRQLLRLLATLHRENMSLRNQLRIDSMTGLFNRCALFDELEREWEHWLRYRRTASLLLVDVNNFKSINDNYGHQVGDDVLIGVAQQLTQQVRATDWLARIGGDEFAILLRDTDSAEAHHVAEKLREQPFILASIPASTQLVIRCAVGVATLNPNIDSVRQWLEAADRRMYRHKRFTNLRLHSV